MSVRIVSGMTRIVCTRHDPVFTCPLDCPHLSPDNTKSQVRPVPLPVPTCSRPVPVPCPLPIEEGTGGQARGQGPFERTHMTPKTTPTRPKRAVSAANRADVLAAKICRYCSDLAGPFEVDHLRPLSRGGDNHRDNLGSACVSCNTQKSNMLLHEWQQWRTANGMTWPPIASHPTQPAHYADCCGTCRDTIGELPAVTVPHRLAPDEGASYWAYYRCQTCQTAWRTWWSANIGYYSDCTCTYCAMCRLEGAA